MFDRAGQRVLRGFAVALLSGTLAWGAGAEDSVAPPEQESALVTWVRSVGRAVGGAIRDIGSEAKRVGLAIGDAATRFGKDVGKGAASAGKEVGQAAKEGGKAFGKAITGKDGADNKPAGKENSGD